MPTLERIWIAYLLTVIAVATLAAPEHDPSYSPLAFLLIQLTLLGTAISLHYIGPQLTRSARRFWHCVLVAIGLPAVFSSIGWILPAVHPEPFEWTWIAWDRKLFGDDPSVMAQAVLSPWFTELLQWVYASFYFIPVAAVLGAARSGGAPAFDRAMTTVVFCFLFSYLGYLLWPTLPPKAGFLYYDQPLEGLWITDNLRQIIDAYEKNHWDCFPSGHTMLSLVSLVVCWRWARKLLPILIPVVVLMIFSTVALRYHYVLDVLAGILFVWPSVWLCDRLYAMDRTAIPKDSDPRPAANMSG